MTTPKVAEINALATAEGISVMAWKQRAIRAESQLPAGRCRVEIQMPSAEEWWNMVLGHEGMSENSARFTAHDDGMRDTIKYLRERARPAPPQPATEREGAT